MCAIASELLVMTLSQQAIAIHWATSLHKSSIDPKNVIYHESATAGRQIILLFACEKTLQSVWQFIVHFQKQFLICSNSGGPKTYIINNIFEVRHEVLSLMLVLSKQPGHIVPDDCKMTIIKFVFEIVVGGKATGKFLVF